jgi:adenylate cyclase
MTEIFISYARSTEQQARMIAEALRGHGFAVWRDDELPAHRAYADVIEERLNSAKAVLVIWSSEAVRSQWVRAEADVARTAGRLVQLSIDGAVPPLPFNQIQCAELSGWNGDTDAAGWRKAVASIAELLGRSKAERQAPLPLPSKPSIAVMPFANLSGDPEQEYFADGMVVEIATALSRIKSIFTIASGSSLSFKGRTVGAQEAARELGVRYVLEGSVRKAGGRVRISVQLIDASDGAQIWTQRFEDTLEDIFDLQDKVALSAAAVIGPAVREAEIRRASARTTENMSSYELYLRALPKLRRRDSQDVLGGLELLNRAIALDPDYAAALAEAAFCHYLINLYGWTDDPESRRREGIALARRALASADQDAEVLANAARSVAGLEEDIDAGLALVERAIALNPGAASAWLFSAAMRLRLGDADVAVEHLETAMRLDPVGPDRASHVGNLAQARFQQGRFPEAVALLKEAGQARENPSFQAYLAASYGQLGLATEAAAALQRYQELSRQPIKVFARTFVRKPAALKLFLQGIAVAEGKSVKA